MRIWFSLILLFSSACFVKNNTAYCDTDEQCQNGLRCDTQFHRCSSVSDGGNSDGGGSSGTGPVLDSIDPVTLGRLNGGVITLHGSRFQPGMTVTVDQTAAIVNSVSAAGDTASVTVPTSESACGLVPVLVKNPDEQSTLRNDLFRYGFSTVNFSTLLATQAQRNSTSLAAIDRTGGYSDLALVSGNANAFEEIHILGPMDPPMVMEQSRPGIMGSYQSVVALELDSTTVKNPDLITFSSLGLTAWRGNTDSTFQEVSGSRLTFNCVAVAAADFDGNTFPDLVTVENSATFKIYPGDGNLLYPAVQPKAITTPNNQSPSEVFAGDIDGDQQPDIALLLPNASPPQVMIYFNTGGVTFSLPPKIINLPVGVMPKHLHFVDVDGDAARRPDLLLYNSASMSISVFANQGNRNFANPQSINLGSAAELLQVGDFTCDGLPDIVYAVRGGMSFSYRRNIGNSTTLFSPAVSVMHANPTSALVITPLSGDLLPDVAVLTLPLASANDQVTLFRNSAI